MLKLTLPLFYLLLWIGFEPINKPVSPSQISISKSRPPFSNCGFRVGQPRLPFRHQNNFMRPDIRRSYFFIGLSDRTWTYIKALSRLRPTIRRQRDSLNCDFKGCHRKFFCKIQSQFLFLYLDIIFKKLLFMNFHFSHLFRYFTNHMRHMITQAIIYCGPSIFLIFLISK